MLLCNDWLIKGLLRPSCDLGIFFCHAQFPKAGTEERGSDPAEGAAGQSFSDTSSPILQLGRGPLPGVLLSQRRSLYVVFASQDLLTPSPFLPSWLLQQCPLSLCIPFPCPSPCLFSGPVLTTTNLAVPLPDWLLFEGLSPEWVSVWKVGILRLRPWWDPQQFHLHLQGVLKSSGSITGLERSGESSGQADPLNP